MNFGKMHTLTTSTRRRTAVVNLWVSFTLYVWTTATRGHEGNMGMIAAAFILVGMGSLMSLGRTIGLQLDDSHLDERELAERDRTHVRAYRTLMLAMAVPLAYGFVALRMGLWLPSSPREVVGTFAAIVCAVGLVPLSMLAWTRRDPPPDGNVPAPVAGIRRFPIHSPGRRIIAGLLVASGSLLIARLAGATLLGTLDASELAGLATAFAVGLLITRTEKD